MKVKGKRVLKNGVLAGYVVKRRFLEMEISKRSNTKEYERR